MLKVNQNYAIPNRVKETFLWGQNGLMPIRSSDKNDQQQFIPPTILASLIHYAEQQQWDYAAWFQNSGLDIAQIQQTQAVVRFSQLCDVVGQAMTTYQQPNLGLKLGSSEGLISMGILGFAMQSCKTVADALDIALRYHRISGSVSISTFQFTLIFVNWKSLNLIPAMNSKPFSMMNYLAASSPV
jgi:hypothetical protein